MEVIMLKLLGRRQPLKDHAFSAEKSFDATLHVDHLDDDQRWLSLSFVTNPDGQNVSRFGLAIYPRDFGELARMMVDADPTAAMQAFGIAMQAVQVERRQQTVGEDAAYRAVARKFRKSNARSCQNKENANGSQPSVTR
jgi:hypothetical protein